MIELAIRIDIATSWILGIFWRRSRTPTEAITAPGIMGNAKRVDAKSVPIRNFASQTGQPHRTIHKSPRAIHWNAGKYVCVGSLVVGFSRRKY